MKLTKKYSNLNFLLRIGYITFEEWRKENKLLNLTK